MKAITILFITISILGVACTKDFDETNTDPNKLEKVGPSTLLNPILYEMTFFNMQRAEDFTFQIMQVALPFPSAVGGIHRYDVTESSGNSTWNTYYRWLANLREMKTAALESQDPNYQAIAMTLNAWIYSLLSDCFGNVPMEEANRGEEALFKPKFDEQQAIYTQLIADLDSANNLYNTGRKMIYQDDLLFKNNVPLWKRFSNSLRLRLLLRVSKRTEMDAFTKMAAMFTNPTKYPIFTHNDTSAVLRITGLYPNISPWGRPQDFTTGQAKAAFILDKLNAVSDPRRARWATQAKHKTTGANIGFKGITSGYTGDENQFDFTPSNKVQGLIVAPMIAPIMTYSEVEFIRAELIQRGVLTGNAQAAYENGVKASITLWGGTVPANYFTNVNAAYDGTLERILLQKYFALYFCDYQQWFEYRRTGFPVLPTADGMMNNKVMPVRFRYPVTIQIQNKANYDKAVQAMGGDNINTKVWWEK